jgi:hypothetical protein
LQRFYQWKNCYGPTSLMRRDSRQQLSTIMTHARCSRCSWHAYCFHEGPVDCPISKPDASSRCGERCQTRIADRRSGAQNTLLAQSHPRYAISQTIKPFSHSSYSLSLASIAYQFTRQVFSFSKTCSPTIRTFNLQNEDGYIPRLHCRHCYNFGRVPPQRYCRNQFSNLAIAGLDLRTNHSSAPIQVKAPDVGLPRDVGVYACTEPNFEGNCVFIASARKQCGEWLLHLQGGRGKGVGYLDMMLICRWKSDGPQYKCG